jgi:hypothetical protein
MRQTYTLASHNRFIASWYFYSFGISVTPTGQLAVNYSSALFPDMYVPMMKEKQVTCNCDVNAKSCLGNLILVRKGKKGKSYPCNRAWRSIELWDVEDTTFSRQSSHRWWWDVSFMRQPPFTPQEYSWYWFLLEAESTPGPQRGWKDYVNWKIRWPYRESNPRPSGL